MAYHLFYTELLRLANADLSLIELLGTNFNVYQIRL